MKKAFTLLCYLFPTLLLAQSPPNPYFSQMQAHPCPYDSTETVWLPANWEVYQTLDGTWDGPRDSTRCLGFLPDEAKFILEQMDPQKPLFIRSLLTDENKVLLLPDWLYEAVFLVTTPGDINFNLALDCPESLCTGSIIGIEVPSESGDSTTLRIYKNALDYQGVYLEEAMCIPTEYFEQNYLREYILKFSPDAFSAGSFLFLRSATLWEGFEVDKIYDLPVSEAYFDGNNSYTANIEDLVEVPSFSGAYLLMHEPNVYPSFDNITLVEATPEPNPMEQRVINVFVESWQSLTFQPFTFVRGGLVSGSDTLHHQLNLVNDGGDFCFSSVIDLVFSDDSYLVYQGGHINFASNNSCMMFHNKAGLVIGDDVTMNYGQQGIGALALGKRGTIKFGKNSQLIINNRLVLWDYYPHPNSQVYLDLQPGNALIFGEHGSLEISNTNGPGYMKLNVYMNGGILDDHLLSLEERQLINRIYPSVEDNLADNIHIRPNPVEASLNFSINATQDENALYRIINLSGQVLQSGHLLLSKGLSQQEIGLETMPTGLYYLEVINTQGKATKAFIRL